MIELDEVENARYSPEMHILKVHMINRVITKIGFQYLQVYQIASYKKPFNDKWYHREDGSEPSGQFDLPENFHPSKSRQSVLKGKLRSAGYNVHASLSGTANNVFLTERKDAG